MLGNRDQRTARAAACSRCLVRSEFCGMDVRLLRTGGSAILGDVGGVISYVRVC